MAKKKKKKNQRASQLASNSKQNKQQQSAKSNKYQRKQERYLEKKRQQKEKEIPKKLSKLELMGAIGQYQDLQLEANHRIEMIQHAGYTSYALDRVIKEGGQDYFDLEQVKTREELVREVTRMRVFINDKGSTIEGARLQTAEIYGAEYKGKFGNEFNNKENQYARFDIKAIDKDVASRAFESYRKIESLRASQIGKQEGGDGGYGSENLIIALYDAEIRGHDSYNYGIDLLDAFVTTESDEWKKATEESNMIMGITGDIEDNITGRFLF